MVPGAKYVAGEVEAAAFPTQSRWQNAGDVTSKIINSRHIYELI